MKMLNLFTLGLVLSMGHSFAQDSLTGAWWAVNSPVVSIISKNDDGTYTDTQCESEEYFTQQTCNIQSEDKYFFNKELNGLCLFDHSTLPKCWLLKSVSQLDQNTLYTKADPFNTQPGLGYAYSSQRLKKGVWPMKQ